MRLLAVHPGPLMYTKIFLRLEPLGLELVAQAARQAGHEVRLLDLQVENQDRYLRTIDAWRPHVVAFSCNYLANIPEIVDLAKETKRRWPDIFVFVGRHSVSFTAAEIWTRPTSWPMPTSCSVRRSSPTASPFPRSITPLSTIT